LLKPQQSHSLSGVSRLPLSWVLFLFSTLIVVTDASATPSRNMQTISAIYFWRLGYQVLSSKTLASRTTAPNAELFTIRLEFSKATSIKIEHIILITDSLDLARREVDPLVYSEQTHSLTVCSALRSFFSGGLSHRIEFWGCPSKAEWSLYQMVYNDVTNTRVAAGHHLVTFMNSLCSKNVLSCLNTWKTAFNCPTVWEHYFLTLRNKNHKSLQSSYSKGSSWLTYFGQSVTSCARITRAILNNAPIGEYRQCFFPAECT